MQITRNLTCIKHVWNSNILIGSGNMPEFTDLFLAQQLVCNMIPRADLGGPPLLPPLFLLVNIFLEPYICPYAKKISSCIDLKCLLYVVQLLKYNLLILYSIIPTLHSVAMLPHAFGPPYSKILDPPLDTSVCVMYSGILFMPFS